MLSNQLYDALKELEREHNRKESSVRRHGRNSTKAHLMIPVAEIVPVTAVTPEKQKKIKEPPILTG